MEIRELPCKRATISIFDIQEYPKWESAVNEALNFLRCALCQFPASGWKSSKLRFVSNLAELISVMVIRLTTNISLGHLTEATTRKFFILKEGLVWVKWAWQLIKDDTLRDMMDG